MLEQGNSSVVSDDTRTTAFHSGSSSDVADWLESSKLAGPPSDASGEDSFYTPTKAPDGRRLSDHVVDEEQRQRQQHRQVVEEQDDTAARTATGTEGWVVVRYAYIGQKMSQGLLLKLPALAFASPNSENGDRGGQRLSEPPVASSTRSLSAMRVSALRRSAVAAGLSDNLIEDALNHANGHQTCFESVNLCIPCMCACSAVLRCNVVRVATCHRQALNQA